MRYNLLFIFACLLASLQAQQPSPAVKGASPLRSEQAGQVTGQTYALVVGVSDYQDPGIPDLRFADKDAEAFAAFLKSRAGGSLDADHLKVLINQDATAAQFAIALDWLLEAAKQDDRVIIYFSGHGDVEKKTLTQPGFLLCWDAPARVYMAGGAFALPMLQEVVSTLSVQNQAKVVVIMDACRSGKLAGSTIGGAQATAANLAKQYANEVKILSCQPNEYSIEGEQWGGGRGAFSYNLVNGLYGLADANNDLHVNLKEVSRYLEDRVSEEVAPVPQNPQVIGNPVEVLTEVDAGLLARIRSGKATQMSMLSAIDSRGMEEDVLAGVDTLIRLKYKRFKEALKEKRFLEPSSDCAEAYYAELIREPGLDRLHSAMRRNYAAALQDDAQQVINILLKTGLSSEILSDEKAPVIYRNYPAYLERAAELLGKEHYIHAALQARKHFFEGKMAATKLEQRRAFHQALKWQPDMPHALVNMLSTFEASQVDSAEFYFAKAVSQVPNWVVPYTTLANFYNTKVKQAAKAEALLNQAGLVDSASLLVWYQKARFYETKKNFKLAEYWYLKTISRAGNEICFPCAHNQLGILYSVNGQIDKSEEQYRIAIQMDSTFTNAYCNLADLLPDNRIAESKALMEKAYAIRPNDIHVICELGIIYNIIQNFAKSEVLFRRAIQLDSNYYKAWYGLGYVLSTDFTKFPEAEAALLRAIQIDSAQVMAHYNLGNIYLNSNRLGEAEKCFQKTIQVDSTYIYAINNLGLLYTHAGRYVEAESLFRKSIRLNPRDFYAYDFLGWLLSETQRFAEAEQAYLEAIRLNPSTPRLWNSIGTVYGKGLLRYDEARQAFQKAIALDSTFYFAYYNLGNICVKTGRLGEARQYMLKVLRLQPEDPGILSGMSYLLFAEGKTAEALDYAEQAIKKGSTYEQLEQNEDLEPLRALPEWKELMRKYFPDKG